jgi:hypothetical protein
MDIYIYIYIYIIVRKPEGNSNQADFDLDGRTTLKCISEEWHSMVWCGPDLSGSG